MERKQAKLKARLEMQELERGASQNQAACAQTEISQLAAADFYSDENAGAENVAAAAGLDFERRPRKSPQELTSALAASEHKSRLMMDMTIAELLRTFGTMDNIEQFSKIQRDLSVADEREQRTQERRLELIQKEFVEQRLFGYIDSLMGLLLDVPESVCDQVIATALSGGEGSRAAVIGIISDGVTKCISGAKQKVVGELCALKGRREKREEELSALKERLEESAELQGE